MYSYINGERERERERERESVCVYVRERERERERERDDFSAIALNGLCIYQVSCQNSVRIFCIILLVYVLNLIQNIIRSKPMIMTWQIYT